MAAVVGRRSGAGRLWAASGRPGVQVPRRAAATATAAERRPDVVFVIGGPGSGKGTQCELIAKEHGYVHLSAGDLLRAERKLEDSPLRRVIDEAITGGGTVPSEVIASLLEKAMRNAGWAASRFVVDGYPRSVEQLRGWERTLSAKVNLFAVVSLEVTREAMKARLLQRGQSSGRADDNEETIEKRFVTFLDETGPLLEHFDKQGLLCKVDGGKSKDEVWAGVKKCLADALGGEGTQSGEGSGEDVRSVLLKT